ncbi:hypothetical protein ACIOD1_09915 [Streptomyces sp. NPDC088097]|uniref:hypothetical protein n=1 Tax=Streptomyces sp. NPDC088097 TaxID=3365823 RepID=UPI00381005F7
MSMVERAMGPAERAAVEERVRRDWGLELPDSIFRFWTFLGSLDPAGQSAFRDLDMSPMGVLDLFPDASLAPRDGIDVRVHGRYYRDPPEFLTFLHGGSDGLHHGLWFDDGRTCRGVASYYNNDGGEIDTCARTPLETVRATLEHVWRDLDDDPDGYGDDVGARLTRLGGLRDAVTAFETGDRPEVGHAYSSTYGRAFEPVRPDRITTLDGAGALASGESVLGRPAHDAADPYKFGTYMYALFDDAEALRESVAQARRRCAAGDPTEALLLGRDLHWASRGDRAVEDSAHELLVSAYRALDRPALAGITEAHHRHRSLAQVDVLDTRKAESPRPA